MFANLATILPIFAFVAVGWIARKSGALGLTASREISRLVLYLALPALLFEVMVSSDLDALWRPDFIFAYAIGCAVIFGATLAVRMQQGKDLADAAIDGLNGSCANTGFIGFPLLVAVMGQGSMGLTLIASVLTVCVLFLIGLLLIEVSMLRRRQNGGSSLGVLRRVGLALVTNPIFVAPFVGTVFLVTELDLPQPVDAFFSTLGAAASPCALIALGLFFADVPARHTSTMPWQSLLLVTVKLLVHPAATWAVAGPLLGLPTVLVQAAVLLAALPTGTTPLMLAAVHHRETETTSKVVITGTVLSILTLPIWLNLLQATGAG